MSNETDGKQKARMLLAMAIALGGEAMAVGIDRIIDGNCPDCGENIDDHPDRERCHRYVENEE